MYWNLVLNKSGYILKMENFSWDNKTGMRIIVDCWSDNVFSYSLIIYPNNQLRLTFIRLNK